MKLLRIPVLVLSAIALTIIPAYSQSGSCGDSSQYQILRAHCYSPVCSGMILLVSAASCSDPSSCDFFENVTMNCCGFQAVVTEDVGGCGVARLRDKRARRQLLALLKNQHILVPACGGAYVPASSLLKQK
jgi:hypothetical protein